MAMQVATLETAVNEFELHVFEFAYLMSLLRVETVAALPDAVLFPPDPAIRKKMLANGEQRLIANARMTPSETSGDATYDEDLLSMATAVGDPRFTILARRETAHGERADATIYFNNVEVVEVTQTNKQAFRLRRLSEPSEAFQYVRKMLGVTPHIRHAESEFELRIESFQQVRRQVADGQIELAVADLVEAGLPIDAAAEFADALATPERKGVVSVLKHVAQKVADVRVLGFYLCHGSTWLTSVVSEPANRVRVEAVDTDRFIRRLVERVASVCA